jgi:hypothetical protein
MCASIPVVGSSRIISFGLPIKLIANDKRRRIPPEKVDTFPFLFSYKFTDCKHFFISINVDENPLS